MHASHLVTIPAFMGLLKVGHHNPGDLLLMTRNGQVIATRGTCT